ncbi:hypothetical protein U6G28_00100 [Actinomycetaceae bacterium MB13-C1-2]|nr:hypothetical protein U6G28_00100 [Actinomycetaceae bacterium MB13-C1-2]
MAKKKDPEQAQDPGVSRTPGDTEPSVTQSVPDEEGGSTSERNTEGDGAPSREQPGEHRVPASGQDPEDNTETTAEGQSGDEKLVAEQPFEQEKVPEVNPDPIDPYYRAPSYANGASWTGPSTLTSKPTKSLNPAVVLGSLGVILVIMAVGLLIAIFSGVGGGEILTVTAGLCVLVVALVLGYAALWNLKVGWFVGASAVAAVALVPVVVLGNSLASYQQIESSISSEIAYEEAYQDAYFEVASFEDDLFSRIADREPEFTFYDWQGHPMAIASETAVIDMTTEDFENVDSDAFIETVASINAFAGANVYVLLPADTTPLIYDDGSVNSTFIATRWEQAGQMDRLEATGWIATHSQGDLNQLDTVWDLNLYSGNSREIQINVHAENSTITFIQVAEPDPRGQLVSVTTSGTDDPQSDSQSTDLSAEQSAVREAEEALARAKEAEEAKRAALEAEIAEKQAELKKLEEATSATEGQE